MTATPRQDKSKKPASPGAPTSSQGDSPVEMTPLDISPEDASWKDRKERDINAKNAEERVDALLDEASDLSFPASDPIAVPSVTRIEKTANTQPQKKKDK